MISLILLGAGIGKRFKFPKSFFKIENYPLYFFPLKTFSNFKEIDEIILTIPKGKKKKVEKEIEKFGINKKILVVEGGKERIDSLKNAVLKSKGDTLIIHDVARPFVPQEIIKKILKKEGDLVVPFLKVYDTSIYDDKVLKREKIKLIQTPQKIKREILLEAIKKAKNKKFTDESTMITETLNIKPKYINGSQILFKITYPQDIKFLKILWKGLFIPLIGFGYDIHKLVEGRKLYIGGIHIPYSKGALGHSDGDVLIHSIVDAILGAIGEGDIGEHFPPTSPKWKNVRSEIFLKKCLKMMEEKNIIIGNIDSVIFLEKPKLGNYKEKIRKNIAKILKVPKEKISIKAKTFEKMGMIGKEMAIGAHSFCLLFQKIFPPVSSTVKTRS
jgi:2-C-methyl-D-erythritol 4-phosphate cytidylyltransferase/2-C-methyl-D-erythritol 2,4-cyclodiphosphate synthase